MYAGTVPNRSWFYFSRDEKIARVFLFFFFFFEANIIFDTRVETALYLMTVLTIRRSRHSRE